MSKIMEYQAKFQAFLNQFIQTIQKQKEQKQQLKKYSTFIDFQILQLYDILKQNLLDNKFVIIFLRLISVNRTTRKYLIKFSPINPLTVKENQALDQIQIKPSTQSNKTHKVNLSKQIAKPNKNTQTVQTVSHQSFKRKRQTYPKSSIFDRIQDQQNAQNQNKKVKTEDQQNKSNKIRCKYFPQCKKPQCPYVHPQQTCNFFPKCKYGGQCLKLHPSCKFGKACQRPDCFYEHEICSAKRKKPNQHIMSELFMKCMMNAFKPQMKKVRQSKIQQK